MDAIIGFDTDAAGALPQGWEHTANGRRNTIKYVHAPVPAKVWHTLRVDFSSRHIRVTLNGKAYIELDDDHIKGPGAVGLWTKADSVTVFDDFVYGR